MQSTTRVMHGVEARRDARCGGMQVEYPRQRRASLATGPAYSPTRYGDLLIDTPANSSADKVAEIHLEIHGRSAHATVPSVATNPVAHPPRTPWHMAHGTWHMAHLRVVQPVLALAHLL